MLGQCGDTPFQNYTHPVTFVSPSDEMKHINLRKLQSH